MLKPILLLSALISLAWRLSRPAWHTSSVTSSPEPNNSEVPTSSPASTIQQLHTEQSELPEKLQNESEDFFVGEVEFTDIFCGLPKNPYFRFRRSPPNPIDVHRLTHSLLRFRDQVFEWGVAPLSLKFRKSGYMERDPKSECIEWDNKARGFSTCTIEQAKEWADNYHVKEGSYNLLTNNCHMFVRSMMEFLETGC